MEISKFRLRLPIALEPIADHLRAAKNRLTRVAASFAEELSRLRGAAGAGKNELHQLRAHFLSTIVTANRNIVELRSQLSVVLEQVKVHLRPGWNALARLGSSAADIVRRLREALRAGKNELRESLTSSFSAATFATRWQIAKFRAQLLMALKQVIVNFRRGWNTLARPVRRVVDMPQIRREALRTSENELNQLLTSSLEAILVTDGHHRFIAANPKALDLFGVSRSNLTRFTLDIFLSRRQVADFRGSGSALRGRQERHGKWKITRLDGSLRTVEYVLVANFLPFLHLYRFSDVTPQKRRVPHLVEFKPPTAIIKYRPTTAANDSSTSRPSSYFNSLRR